MIRLTAVIELEGHAPRALTHESNARQVVIGRDPSCDFPLPLTTVSRQHARIQEDDGVYTLEDLGSTHGTAIGEQALEPGQKRVLKDGDQIILTQARITCSIEGDKVASAERGEATQAIAARAVQGILGRLGEAKKEGPHLRIISGAGEGTRFPLTGSGGSEWTLGRSADCECVLGDPNVSRKHATVKRDWNGYVIHDLGSKNGVQIGDRPIQRPRRLRDRDEITIGPIRLVFIDPDADLLAALKDVPGFAVDEPELEGPEAPAAAAEGGEPLDLPEVPIPPPPVSESDAEAARMGEIDASLLENPHPAVSLDWAIMAGAAVLVSGAGFVLYALLSK